MIDTGFMYHTAIGLINLLTISILYVKLDEDAFDRVFNDGPPPFVLLIFAVVPYISTAALLVFACFSMILFLEIMRAKYHQK